MNETSDFALRATRDLADIVWEAQSVAMASAASACAGLKDERIMRAAFPRQVRCFFAQALLDAPLPDGWDLNIDISHGCLIELRGFGMTLRYLKENPSVYPDGIPPAGRNPARQHYWENEGLLPLPLEMLQVPQRFLLLWSVPDTRLGEDFAMRIVHPIGAGSFRTGTPLDLSLDLTPGIGLESRLAFRGDADDTNFFAHLETENVRAD